MFYRAINELYGPSSRGVAPLLSSDGQTLVTNHEDILKRWLEHFSVLLNRPLYSQCC